MISESKRVVVEEWEKRCTGQIIDKGYHRFLLRGHPRADSKGYVRTHILVAEKVLGKPLPPKAVVHHVGDKLDLDNLVICENNSYHKILHTRMDALKNTGDPNKRVCSYCHAYDDPPNLVRMKVGSHYHRECMRSYSRKYNKEVRGYGKG